MSSRSCNSRSVPLIVAVAITARVIAVSVPNVRTAQTSAICQSDFSWMENGRNLSPCLVDAYVEGACTTNNWVVPSLVPPNQYDPPNATTVNGCTCSWASYNLLMACTACQGDDSSILAWAAYLEPCGSTISTTDYFPPDVSLPDQTTIPFWASMNPANWTNGQFDVAEAEVIAKEGHPDLIPGGASLPSNSPAKKKDSIVGPVVGGVLGGLAGILVVLAVVLFFIRRNRGKGDIPSVVGGGGPGSIMRSLAPSSIIGSARFSPRPTMHRNSPSNYSQQQLYPNRPGEIWDSPDMRQRGAGSPAPTGAYETGALSTVMGSVRSVPSDSFSLNSRLASPPPASMVLGSPTQTSSHVEVTPFASIPSQPERTEASGSGLAARPRLNPPAYRLHANSQEQSSIQSAAPQAPQMPPPALQSDILRATSRHKPSHGRQNSQLSTTSEGNSTAEASDLLEDLGVGRPESIITEETEPDAVAPAFASSLGAGDMNGPDPRRERNSANRPVREKMDPLVLTPEVPETVPEEVSPGALSAYVMGLDFALRNGRGAASDVAETAIQSSVLGSSDRNPRRQRRSWRLGRKSMKLVTKTDQPDTVPED